MTHALLALEAPRTFSCRIPFGGFYESLYSSEIDREQEQTVDYYFEDRARFESELPELAAIAEHLDEDDVKSELNDIFLRVTEYSDAYAEVAKAYVSTFETWLDDTLEGDAFVAFEEMTSPRYYNFETDRLFAGVSENAIREIAQRLADEAPDLLPETFRDMFTSRDGFASHYDNAVPEKDLAEWDHNELYALLCAWVSHNDVENLDYELYDYEIGGLYEVCSNAFSNAVDWDELRKLAAEYAEEQREELGLTEEDERPARCTETLELPLVGGAA